MGRTVRDAHGHSMGRIEELRAERRGGDLVVIEFHLGARGLVERLAAWPVARRLLRQPPRGVIVPWDRLDLSDPRQPRLVGSVAELSRRGDVGSGPAQAGAAV